MLGVVKANLDQRNAERSYGIAEPKLTPAQGWSLARLRKSWSARKSEVAPWWGSTVRGRTTRVWANAIHEATTNLATRHEVVVIEQLCVKNLSRRGGRRKRGLNQR